MICEIEKIGGRGIKVNYYQQVGNGDRWEEFAESTIDFGGMRTEIGHSMQFLGIGFQSQTTREYRVEMTNPKNEHNKRCRREQYTWDSEPMDNR